MHRGYHGAIGGFLPGMTRYRCDAAICHTEPVSTTSSNGNRLWSVTEVPGRRMVFWVYTAEMQ